MPNNYLKEILEILSRIEYALNSRDLKKSITEYNLLKTYILNPLVDMQTKKFAHDKGLELYARMVKLRRDLTSPESSQENQYSADTPSHSEKLSSSTLQESTTGVNFSPDPAPKRRMTVNPKVKSAIIFVFSIVLVIVLIKGAMIFFDNYNATEDCYANYPFECKSTSLGALSLANNGESNFIILKLEQSKEKPQNINIAGIADSLKDCDGFFIDQAHFNKTKNSEIKIIINCTNTNLSEILGSLTLSYTLNNEERLSEFVFGNSTLVKEIKKNQSLLNESLITPEIEHPAIIENTNSTANTTNNNVNSSSSNTQSNPNTATNSSSRAPSGSSSGGGGGSSGNDEDEEDETPDPTPDTTPPNITLINPQNITYNTTTIPVNISSDGNYIWFNIGGPNFTYVGYTEIIFGGSGTYTLTAYANDTSGNRNSTNITFSLNIPVNNTPVATTNSPENNSYFNKNYVLLNTTIYEYDADNTTIIIYGDYTPQNISYNITNSTTIIHNWTSLADGTHNWAVVASDGNSNSTIYYNFFITDSSAPIYMQNSTNTTEAGASATFSIMINDTIALFPNGQYIFSTNNTGIWVNDSAVNFTSTNPQWANATKILNSTNGTRIGYRWYVSDNLSNTNTTPTYLLTIINTTSNVSSQNCGTLSTSGIYTLTSNVSSNGTCFTITADNITLDCGGYWITYSINGTTNTYGVYTDKLNTTVKNCKILDGNWSNAQVTRPGIYYNNAPASNGRIENNFINTSNSRGIQLSSAQNNTIINNTAISTSGIGIRLGSTANNNTLINNTAASISANGIEISASNNTLMLNNTGISNSSLGIYLTSSSNCNLTSNRGTSNNSIGLRVASSTNVTLTNNTGVSNSGTGIEIYLYANNNLLIGNNGTGGSTGNGIWIESSNGTIMYSNFGYTNGSGAGIRVDTSQNNNLTRNTGISGTNQGLYLIDSSNNNFTANTFYGEYGYYFRNAGNMNISDCIYVSSGTSDVYIHPDSGSANISFINCSYNKSKEVMFNANNYLIRQWYFEANITNISGNPVENANITIYNSTGAIVYSELTNSTGNINKLAIIEYIGAAGGRNYSTPHTINVTLDGYYSNSTTYNITLITNTRANITLYLNTTNSSDTIAPTYSLNQTNTTEAGASATFSIYINDTTALHPNGQYTFSTNNTGIWVNDSAVNFTTTPSWANTSKTLNSTVGTIIGYRWYITDNQTNANNTITYQLTTNTTTDTIAPTYSSNQTNTTEAGTSATFSIYINDTTALHPNGQYTFSTNNTGIWVNDSPVNFTATPQWANTSKTLNSTVGIVIGYRWYVKDNSNNTNNTILYQLTTTDISAPSASITSPSNGASVSATANVSANASDNSGVAGVQFIQCAVSQSGDISSNYTYPLEASSNGHYLVDQNSKPFYILGDSAWSLVAQLNETDIEIYLNARQAQGFNAILTNILEHKFSTNAPNNDNNEAPFTGADFITPNEDYFTHLDFVVNESAQRNIVLFLFPVYLGWQCTDEGWCVEIQNTSESNMTYWGAYLGNRYGNYTNIVWVVDGDANAFTYNVENKTRAFVTGLRSYDNDSLITAHSKRSESSLDVWTNESWLTLNGVYTTNNASSYTDSKRGYQRTPAIPSFYLEGQYEHASSITVQHLREQAYWSSLYGSAGHFYGNCPVWSLDYDTGFCTFLNWKTELNSSGARNMTYTSDLFNSRQWHLLVPDFNNTIMTSGSGTYGTTNYSTGALTSNNHTYIAYLPSLRTVTINMSKIAGTQSNAWWFNPLNGTTTLNGTYSNSGLRNFTTPTSADWVLVIDDTALNLSSPGSTAYPLGGCSNIDIEDTSSPYSVFWDTTTVFNGNHSIVARARDNSNNTANSSTIYVTVNN